jgi:hypothetical protein
MRKIISISILFVSLFLSGLSFSASNLEYNSTALNKIIYMSEVSKEVCREYTLIGGQWYLVIHYDDGTIGVFPIPAPPED